MLLLGVSLGLYNITCAADVTLPTLLDISDNVSCLFYGTATQNHSECFVRKSVLCSVCVNWFFFSQELQYLELDKHGRTNTLRSYLLGSVIRQINLEQLIQNTFLVKEVYSTLLFRVRIRH